MKVREAIELLKKQNPEAILATRSIYQSHMGATVEARTVISYDGRIVALDLDNENGKKMPVEVIELTGKGDTSFIEFI